MLQPQMKRTKSPLHLDFDAVNASMGKGYEAIPLSVIQALTTEAFKTDGHLSVHKLLIEKLGLVPACLLSYYLYRRAYLIGKFPENQGWFYSSHSAVKTYLNIGEDIIRRNKQKLKKVGIIYTRMAGQPAKEWLWIDYLALLSTIGLGIGKPDPWPSEDQTPILIYRNKDIEIKINKVLEKHFSQEWRNNSLFQEAFKVYLEHRHQKDPKGITSRAITMLANKLNKYPLPIAIAALTQSVENGWTGLFPESIKMNEGKNTPHTKPKPTSNRLGYTGQFQNIKSTKINPYKE